VQSGWLTSHPLELGTLVQNVEDIEWVTTDFKAGDVCIVGLDTLHCSSSNTTKKLRVSCDTRWFPSRELSNFKSVLLSSSQT